MAERFAKGIRFRPGGWFPNGHNLKSMNFDETAFFVCLTVMTHDVRWPFIFLVALLGLSTSCSKPETPELAKTGSPTPAPSVATATTTAVADDFACTLLAKEDAQAVQGEPFQSTKPTGQVGNGLIISQCYFELPTAVNSIVLTVTRKADGGRDPSDSWREIFHTEKSARKEKEEGEAKEPLKVDGVGDEAFWTGTRVGGALYVLKGNCYIRISVGGAGDQAQKMEKSKTLAESVLKRL
jgi:hypothetical protein